MTDLEGITEKLLKKGKSKKEILDRLLLEYKTFKDLPLSTLEAMANAIINEVESSRVALHSLLESDDSILKSIFTPSLSGFGMGEAGVGSRGYGDFFVHSLLTQIYNSKNKKPYLPASALDDTGAVYYEYTSPTGPLSKNDEKEESMARSLIILSKMEGMHSRLSDFPFLAGFHVTRAALRDIYVKGGIPVSLMVDVHLADDGDVGKLFDFQAGIATVAELSDVPIVAGSTLRIGGDMVIGTRLTGGIAAVGIMKYDYFRRNIQLGDSIIMTEGAGGGTITTTALYYNFPEVVKETLNLKFLKACQSLFDAPDLAHQIHAMTDVTNGGLRGDLYEINKESKRGVVIDLQKVESLINPAVLDMLKHLNIDPLGLSLDSLLIFCPPSIEDSILSLLSSHNIKASVIGKVVDGNDVVFRDSKGEMHVLPRFRESSYTPIKKAVDGEPINKDAMFHAIQSSYEKALKKKEKVMSYLLNRD